jgi:hypothetical protein
MNYSKALLLATMAILATFSPADAMERPNQRLITSADPVVSGEGSFLHNNYEKKNSVKKQKKAMQKSGEGDNALQYVPNRRRNANDNQGAGLERLQ